MTTNNSGGDTSPGIVETKHAPAFGINKEKPSFLERRAREEAAAAHSRFRGSAGVPEGNRLADGSLVGIKSRGFAVGFNNAAERARHRGSQAFLNVTGTPRAAGWIH